MPTLPAAGAVLLVAAVDVVRRVLMVLTQVSAVERPAWPNKALGPVVAA